MTIESVLDSLAEQHGHLTPEMVVDAARSPESPLHSHFDWDDSVAAEAWRRDQARHLIMRCRVTVTAKADETITVRRYTAVPRAEGKAHDYVPTKQVILSDKRNIVLERAREELDALRRKYDSLIDFDSLLRDELGEVADLTA